MRWLNRRQSDNIEDRRGFSGGGMLAGGGVVGFIIYLLINLLSGGDASNLTEQFQEQNQNEAAKGVVETTNSSEDEMAKFASVVLADNEDVWNNLFTQMGLKYQEPVMVLFSGQTNSGCGGANAATGPFYCPSDQKVYLDLSFFSELRERFGAPGDFASAYVIAHEVGHHVQYLLGTSRKVQEARSNMSQKEWNKLSVALELQADFYAGVWAHYDDKQNQALDPGDVDEALNAASAIGDDRLQKMSTGRVMPDAFTHGTSEQRKYWFELGYKTGDLSRGDTFRAEALHN